jgi:hypothetical protein
VTLAHSHLVVQHLLKQLEKHAAERSERDHRPAWLTQLIQAAADQFSPLADFGRVGFECEPADDGWEARLYLGSTEVVGGRDDGHWKSASFELDLSGLTRCFDHVDELRWNVAASGGESAGSFVTVRGRIGEQPICLKAYSRAPAHVGPALREYHDGTVEPIE